MPLALTSQLFMPVRQAVPILKLDIDKKSIDEIRDWAGYKLQQVGFDKDYKLTMEGQVLEDLIDSLYI